MGLGIECTRRLAEFVRSESIGGTVLTLGKQDICFTQATLANILLETNFAYLDDSGRIIVRSPIVTANLLGDKSLSQKELNRSKGYISDNLLFACLGFSVVSADASTYEGADIVLNLNYFPPPIEFKNQFDLIIDGGTIEHIFHTPNVLKNIHFMLKPGGYILHNSPANNHVDRGFYQFSPTFYYEYYNANRYKIFQHQFYRYGLNGDNGPTMWMRYYPGSLDSLYAGLDDHRYATWFIAKKTELSTDDVIPEQGAMQSLWNG